MKKFVLYFMSFLALCLWACDDNEGGSGTIDPVSNATATSFIGSVILGWTNPENEDFYYVLISYTDSDGNELRKKVARYDANEEGYVETTVTGFTDTNEYQFSLRAIGYSGAVSSSVVVSGTPQSKETAKDYVIETVTVEPNSSWADVSWVNESGVAVNLIATYVNQSGDEQEVIIDATYTGSSVLPNIVTTTVITIVAENADSGERTEAKTFEITPQIDPDDVIYDNVDYITFGSGAWDIVYPTQDNPDNPYEYTFVTTGTDPQMYCDGMANPIAGTTLVFRYQATTTFTLELYWCDGEDGSATGGRSTTVDVSATSTDVWQTFRYDYDEAMTTHAWAGNTGDRIRFDFGNTAGVTINIRNIHFE